jgi:hypothetical protein
MNKILSSILATTAFFFSTSDASAQSDRMIGTLVRSGSNYTLREFDNPTLLVSSTSSLEGLVGRIVDVTGGIASATSFVASTIGRSFARFSTSDWVRRGRSMSMSLRTDTPGFFLVFAGFDAGVMSLSPYAPDVAGYLWVDPTNLVTVTGGNINCLWSTCLRMPAACKFVGVDIFFQAAIQPTGGPLVFLNREVTRITN